MRKLTNSQNIDPATSDYPKGRTRNETITIAGTIFSNELMGDLIQAFQKLIVLSGVTENDLPDNETNNHQIITALFAQSLPQWKSTVDNVDFSITKFVTYSNGIYYHKTTTNTTIPPVSDSVNWALVLKWTGSGFETSEEARFILIENNITQLQDDVIQLRSYSSKTNVGGPGVGTEEFLVVDAKTISILTTDTNNDFIKLPSTTENPNLYSGQELVVKAKQGSTNNLNIIILNTDLISTAILSVRDSITFVWSGLIWESIGQIDN